MLQISSGILRGTPLHSPKGKQTRPSSERLRQGTFNVLRHFRWPDAANIVEGASVLDLFAGTGAWGIEAMSNGAASVCFVESHPVALRTLQQNLAAAESHFRSQNLEPPEVVLSKHDVSRAYAKLPPARIIFCDPPYGLEWFAKIANLEALHPKLENGGVLLYEAAKEEKIPETSGELRVFDMKNYGDSVVHFFIKNSHAAQRPVP